MFAALLFSGEWPSADLRGRVYVIYGSEKVVPLERYFCADSESVRVSYDVLEFGLYEWFFVVIFEYKPNIIIFTNHQNQTIYKILNKAPKNKVIPIIISPPIFDVSDSYDSSTYTSSYMHLGNLFKYIDK